MLGHQLFKNLGLRHEVRATLHRTLDQYSAMQMFRPGNTYDKVDVRNFESIRNAIVDFRPAAVVNATGIIKQHSASTESIPSIEINSLFPHKLRVLCEETGARLIHMSTDCVFSGRNGNYTENDTPDAKDVYGRSKLLGEVIDAPAITLRTSIIGRELSRKTGLLEWFLAQKAPIKGFRRAIFSGFTTLEMSRIIERILLHPTPLFGLYHVSSSPISKHNLLQLIRDKLGLRTEIIPDDVFQCDRTLNSIRFKQHFNYSSPSWETMIEELAKDTGK